MSARAIAARAPAARPIVAAPGGRTAARPRAGALLGRFGNAGTAALLADRAVVRPKLEVGAVSDPLEREADATADKVVRMKAGGDCAACARGDPCEGEAKVRRASDGGGGGAIPLAPAAEASIRRATSGGEALPEPVRASMEPRFGADFSGVRVHRDAAAADSAQGIGARAYTVGNHIAFGTGQWAPGTDRGDHLIAHELTHTLQDGGATARTVRGDFLDELGDAAGAIVDQAEEAYSDVARTVSEGAEAVADTAGEAWDTATELVADAADTAGDAVSWALTEAGQAAISLASAIATRLGGSLSVGPDGLVLLLPQIQLFPGFELPEIPLPAIGGYFPLAQLPFMVGSVPAVASVGARLSAEPSLVLAPGPAFLRNVSIRIDPFHSVYRGAGQLYVAMAGGPRVVARAGLGGELKIILPTMPPVPLSLQVDGGLRWTATGALIGAIERDILVDYSGGRLTIDTLDSFMAGALLRVNLNAYASARFNGRIICEYIWPGANWQTGRAWQMSVALGISGGPGGIVPTAGSVSAGPFAIEDLLTGLKDPAPGLNCLGFKDLLDEYGEVGPGRGQSICARPLEAPMATGGPAFRHAFAYDPVAGFNYAIRTPLHGSGVTTSCATKHDQSWFPDDPASSDCLPCRPKVGQTQEDVSRCFAGVHAGYPQPSLYRNLPDPADGYSWGPNSNSYAAAMAACCDRFSGAGLGLLPGWNHRPAGACPLPIILGPPPTKPGPSPGAGGGPAEPDCCRQELQLETVRIDKRHKRYGGKTIQVHDGRHKHWRNIKPKDAGDACDAAALGVIAHDNPVNYGSCLKGFIGAVKAKSADYGGQMGSDSAADRSAIVKRVIEGGVEINARRYWGDAGQPVGVDIATGNVTDMARVDGAPNEAHIIPQESSADMTLAQRLAGLSDDDQGAVARAAAGTAALDELFDALDLDPLGEWAMLHIVDELSRRGADIVAPVAARFAERPTRLAGSPLAEALTGLFRRAPDARPAIVAALVAGGDAALGAGAGSHGAATYVVHLADCARLAGRPLPEARPFARAFLRRAGEETERDLFAEAEAAFLAGEGGAASGGDAVQ